MNPVSPYGCSKVFGYNIVRNYRNAYKLHACNGILFNHESPRRGSNFVTNKVVKTAVEIKLGLKDKLELGNLDSYRDWGHSKDYVKAMHLIINHPEPDDFVVSTMVTHSVREMVDYVFKKLDLNPDEFVKQNNKFIRPEELDYLKGDSTKIRETLGWVPEYTFESMLDEMVEYWFNYFKK
jgi:GDPmannose 4,6-dehydratase